MNLRKLGSMPRIKCTLGHFPSPWSEEKAADEEKGAGRYRRLLNRILAQY